MAAMQKILSIMVILLTVSWGMNSAEGGYAERNRHYRPVGILFAPEFKPKWIVMMNVSITSQPMIFPPRAVRKLGIQTSLKPGQHAVMAMLVLLVLSGDVEANPGPIRHPCTICSKCVRNNQWATLCSKCSMWTHANTVGFPYLSTRIWAIVMTTYGCVPVAWWLSFHSWKLTEAPVTRVVVVMMAIPRSSLTLNQPSLFHLDLVSSTATSEASTTLCVTSRTTTTNHPS